VAGSLQRSGFGEQFSQVEAEAGVEFAVAEAGDGEGAAVKFAGEPFAGEGEVEEGGSEGAAEMGAAFAPVETGVGEAAALGAGLVEVEAEGGEGFGSGGGDGVGSAGPQRLDPAGADEVVVEGDGDGARHVVVAAARGTEVARGGGGELPAIAPGEDAEALEGAGGVGSGERVVAMAALHENFDEVFCFEAGQVDAGG